MGRVKRTKNFLKGLKKGAFTAKAKRAGMSVQAYARKVQAKGSKASGTTKRQANFAITSRAWRHVGRKKRG